MSAEDLPDEIRDDFFPDPHERQPRDCPRCGGSGEIVFNNGPFYLGGNQRDPQCEEYARCNLCHGEGVLEDVIDRLERSRVRNLEIEKRRAA